MAAELAVPLVPADSTVTVTLVCALAPRSVQEQVLQLPAGATLAEAIRQAEACCSAPALASQWDWSIWGRRVPDTQVLQAGDRIEATRPLRVDPKVARRERFARQGARAAGLFSKRQRRPR